MDERDEAIRRMAGDLGISPELWAEVSATLDGMDRAQEAANRRVEELRARLDAAHDPIANNITRNWLRPALAAAGIEDVDKYEVSWVREDGFRPGLFAQEGDGTCAVGYSCPPWPDYVYDKARAWPVPVYTQDEFSEDASEDVKPCRPIYCAKHYGNVTEAACTNAYQCPPSES